MVKKKEVQTKLSDYLRVKPHQMSLDGDAYKIISRYKNQLINKYKGTRNITFSDAIREMKKRIKEKK